MAVRVALGAGRAQIVRQLLTESVLLALVGGGIGVLVAAWGLDAFSPLGLSTLPRPDAIQMDGRVLGFALLVSVGAGALFGLLPALHVARGDLQDSLRGRTETQGVSRIRLRGLLVVSEVALAVMLVIGAGLLLRSFANVLEVEPGFDPRLCWLRSRFSLLASRLLLAGATRHESRPGRGLATGVGPTAPSHPRWLLLSTPRRCHHSSRRLAPSDRGARRPRIPSRHRLLRLCRVLQSGRRARAE